MRRLTLALALLLVVWAASTEAATLAVRQIKIGTATANQNPTVTFDSDVLSGSMLVLLWWGSIISSGAATDNRSNDWATFGDLNTAYSQAIRQAVAPNAAAGATTVTMHMTSAGDSLFVAYEITCAITAPQLYDQYALLASANVAAGVQTVGAVTTTVADQILFSFFGTDTGTISAGPGSGWTLDHNGAAPGGRVFGAGHKILSSTGSNQADWTTSATATRAGLLIGFTAASGCEAGAQTKRRGMLIGVYP